MRDYGKIKRLEKSENIVGIFFENGYVEVTVVNNDIINFFSPLYRNQRLSKAIDKSYYKACKIDVFNENNYIGIKTETLLVKIYDCFKTDIYDCDGNLILADYREHIGGFVRRNGDEDKAKEEGHDIKEKSLNKVEIFKSINEDMYFYGFGERPGSIEKSKCHYINWNTDNPAPHGETFLSLYKSIPFFIGMNGSKAFGIFLDNNFKTEFDMGRDNSKYFYFSAEDGNLDYYFINGPKISTVIENYTYLTGRVNMPPKWAIGYQQCRWSYESYDRVMEVANNFRKRNIPCDTIYLDIDYMDGYRVFTWDKTRFKNPKGMIDTLKDMGFKVVTIIDPGVKKEEGYKIYDEGLRFGFFARDKDGNNYVNRVWAGDSVYPDFINAKAREWWARNQKIMIDYGVSGIWNDMNEPASFNGPLPDDVIFDDDGIKINHKEAHNIYGHMMCKATYEGIKSETGKRPFVLTRACYAGTQKYSAVWTGDNQSTWEHLRMSIPMLLNLGLSGFAFCGTDVGGFGHDCTDELLCRWIEVGCFMPLFRNHSALGTRDQEPWAFDSHTEAINKKYINLRYKLMPYFYDLFRISEKNGSPIMRPLFYNYQLDVNTYKINDEFMVGDSILVAPIVECGAVKRMVYLPEGDKWIDYWSGEEYEGGQHIIKNAPIDICIIFVREGAILPLDCTEKQFVDNEYNDISFNIYLSDKDSVNIYENYVDDGVSFNYKDGKYNKYVVRVEIKEDKIYIDFEKEYENYYKEYKNITFNMYNLNGRDIILNGENRGSLRKIGILN